MTTDTLFDYTPDKELLVQDESAIKLICSPFQSHEAGIPEWLKNSSDAYIRENTPNNERLIVLIFNQGSNYPERSISCLDFVGMTSETIEKYFRFWASEEAASQGRPEDFDGQGGHGNGGKCYMTQMFNTAALTVTVKNGYRNKYGVGGGSVRFGYFPNQQSGKDISVHNVKDELAEALSHLNCTFDSLPEKVQNVLQQSQGFSLFTGYEPRDCSKRIPTKNLLESIRNHTQSLRTMEICSVYIVENGKLINARRPLAPTTITPMEGYDHDRCIEIPSKLEDPVTKQNVSTTDDGEYRLGELRLLTSSKRMGWGLKNRHVVRFKTSTEGDIGFVPVAELDIQSAFRDRIYGICSLDLLQQYKMNSRERLAQSAATRAVEFFIAKKIQEYCEEFEAKARREYSKSERRQVLEMNDALDKWKNKFLNETMQGLWGDDSGQRPPRRDPLPTGIPALIQLSLPSQAAGLGIYMQPILSFFDKDGRKIKSVPTQWVCDDYNIATVDDRLSIIRTHSYGKVAIHAETPDGSLKSNSAILEVVHLKSIQIIQPSIELPLGGRAKFRANCTLKDNSERDDVLLDWDIDTTGIVNISSSGTVFGIGLGKTELIAWDTNCESEKVTVQVVPSTNGGTGRNRGRGYPRVFISGEEFDADPDTAEDVILSPDDPPIYQRVQDIDRNIWWINSQSPLAALFLDRTHYGAESNEWRQYHLERYIDVITQIILDMGSLDGESFQSKEWINQWMDQESRIQTMVIDDLKEFLISGDLPS